MEIAEWGLSELVAKIGSKEISAVEVTEHYLTKISQLNGRLNAVVTINDQALATASNPRPGKLSGVPLGIKDLFCTRGLRTTACSNILNNFVPPYTASCVKKLEEQGAFTLAKLNMDEFAMGSSNEASMFGPCKNPWDMTRVPGGSSGGSAAAVAAGMVPAALGSDTGGSIRQPAHFCGVVGIKPTYGSISRFGMVAFASSLDQAGPIGKTVEDCALLLDVMIGQDPADATTLTRQVGELANLPLADLKGVTVGLPKEYLSFALDADVQVSFANVRKALTQAGARLREISLPQTEFAVPVYYLIATSEASANLARYDGVRYGWRKTTDDHGRPISELVDFYSYTRSSGFGEEVKRRIMLGTFALSAGYCDAFYYQACRVRRLIAEDFTQAFKECDLIISPVATSTAFKIGERISDPIKMYNNDVFTTAVSLAGLPGMSLPVEIGSRDLPVGLQIIAPPFQEQKMIRFAKALELVFGFKGGPNVR